jgi:hypothetical protein
VGGHLARNADWIRRDFKLSFGFNFHYILLLSVLHHNEAPLNVSRYSVVKFMVDITTLSFSTYFFFVDK